jgi:4-hydroxybutyrate CoA-transferase
MTRHRDAAGAVAAIESGQRVFVHGAAATPLGLVDALIAIAHPDDRDALAREWAEAH